MLSSMVSAAGLYFFPSVALVLFLLIFAGVVWRVTRPSNRALWHAMAHLPLDEQAEKSHGGAHHER